MNKFKNLFIYWLLLIIALFIANKYLTFAELNLFIIYLALFLALPAAVFGVLYFFKNKYKKESDSYRQIVDVFVYFFVFFLIPFAVVGAGYIYKDIAWFIQYMYYFFPATFIFFLFINKIKYKNKVKNYKKRLFILWGLFILSYIISISYLYIILRLMFRNAQLSL